MKILQEYYSEDSIIWGMLLFLGTLVAAFLAALLFFYFIKLVFTRTTRISKDLFDNKYRFAFVFLFLVIATNIGMSFIDLSPKANFVIDKILYLLMVYAVAHLLIKTMEFVKVVLYGRFDINNKDNLIERKARTQIDFLQKTGNVIVVLFSFAIALMSFGRVRELGASILASAGLAGIILGFAAQKSIANLLAGLQIAFTQPIRYDDALLVENQFGRVEEISLTYVVIKVWDERRLILPISYFLEKPFENWTRTSSSQLSGFELHVDFSLPLEPIRQEVNRLLASEGNSLWDGRVGVVHVTDSNDKCMLVRILISASNSGNAFDLKALLREKLIKFILDNYPECLPRRRYMPDLQVIDGKDEVG